jgi:hypothetical protein
MIALPLFPSRRLFQTELSYHVDSGITKPEDLAGKRLGVAEYQQTAALWIRGILEHDFGVSQYKIHWYMERSEEMSHGSATGFKPPAGISFRRIEKNKSLASTLQANELDVAHVSSPWVLQANALDRSSRIAGSDWSKIRPLFPDRMVEAGRFYKQHGFLPVNHAYIIRAISTENTRGLRRACTRGLPAPRNSRASGSPGRSISACLRARILIDDSAVDWRRSVPIRDQSESADARHDHRVFARAGLTPRRMRIEELVCREHVGFLNLNRS